MDNSEPDVTPCTDENCRSHGELLRLRRQMTELRTLLNRWDTVSKGESWTTLKIWNIIGREDGPAGSA